MTTHHCEGFIYDHLLYKLHERNKSNIALLDTLKIQQGLIAKGVSPGAALAFLIAGPATNAATIAALWKMLGRRADRQSCEWILRQY